MKMKNIVVTGVVCAFVLSMTVSSFGVPIDFDFESEPGGPTFESLTVSNGGIDLTVSGSGYVYVRDMLVPSLGSGSVIGTEGPTQVSGEFTPLTHTFSTDIATATFLFGDAGGDDDGIVSLSLYDASDAFIVTLTQFYGTSEIGGSITVNQTFRSAVFSSDSPSNNLHSVGQEWADVVVVPEPTSIAMVGLVSVLGSFIRRRFFIT